MSLLRYNNEKIITFLDVETSNLALNEAINLPFQVSMIKGRGNEVIQEFDFYIKWPEGLKISKKSAEMTQYNPKTIEEKGIAPEQVFKVLDKELKEADIVCGHNTIGFDIYIIQSFYRKLKKDFYNFLPKILDTFSIAKAIKLEIPYNKQDNFIAWQYRLYHLRAKGLKCSLAALGKEFGIEHDYSKLHDSLQDLRLNWKVWQKMKYMIDI